MAKSRKTTRPLPPSTVPALYAYAHLAVNLLIDRELAGGSLSDSAERRRLEEMQRLWHGLNHNEQSVIIRVFGVYVGENAISRRRALLADAATVARAAANRVEEALNQAIADLHYDETNPAGYRRSQEQTSKSEGT